MEITLDLLQMSRSGKGWTDFQQELMRVEKTREKIDLIFSQANAFQAMNWDALIPEIISYVSDKLIDVLRLEVGPVKFSVDTLDLPSVDYLELSTITSFINVKEKLGFFFLLSYDQCFFDFLACHLRNCPVDETEKAAYIRDFFSEVTNIAVGNSMKLLPVSAVLAKVEYPFTVFTDGLHIKANGLPIWINQITSAYGNLIVSIMPYKRM